MTDFRLSIRLWPASLAVVLGLTVVSLAGTLYSAPPAEPSRAGGFSIGIPMNGRLKNAIALPRRGRGYEQMPVSFSRRARFGVRELVQLVAEAGGRVFQAHRGVPLQVGDLSRYSGGRIDNHGSHQNGRDVDFAFYMRDGRGRPVKPTEFVPFDKNGFSIKPPMVYRFDDRRNWTLVASLLRSNKADVQWIFVSEALKNRLLAEGEKSGAPANLLARARQILKQPRESAHWDHFHVRILCPPGHHPECRDVGPTWGRAR